LGEASKRVASEWNKLSPEEKAVWSKKAMEDKKRYEEELKEFYASSKE
jgi:hypothetical protein